MGKGSNTGKAIVTLAGFAFGFYNPVAFGVKAALMGGLYGAAIGSSLWQATHQQKNSDSSSQASYNFDQIANQISSRDRIPIIYGTRKWGGFESYHLTSSDKSSLIKDIIWCEGEIDSISDVRANDLLVVTRSHKTGRTLTAYDSGVKGRTRCQLAIMQGHTTYEYNGYTWTVTGDESNYKGSRTYEEVIIDEKGLDNCSYTFSSGAKTDSPPSNYSTVGGYRRCAWSRFSLASSASLSGNPTLTAVIKGLKVYDPRTKTTAWSNNPAVCIRDYLLNKRYGAGHFITESSIDQESFNEIADYCDELVTTRIPTTLADANAVNAKIKSLQDYLSLNSDLSEDTTNNINDEIASLQNSLITIASNPVKYTLEVTKRYELNIVISESKSHLEILQDMMAVFGGFLVFSNDKVSLRCEMAQSSVYDFNDDNIIENSLVHTQYPIESSSNQFKVTFYDPNNYYTGVSIIVDNLPSQKKRGKLITKEVDLVGCTSQSQASRLARMYRDKVDTSLVYVSFQTGTQAMHLECGDVVTLTKYKYPNGVKTLLFDHVPFRITKLEEDSGIYTIEAEQYNASIYDDSVGAQIQIIDRVALDNPYTDIVPNVTAVASNQNYYIQRDGAVISTLTLTYTIPSYSFINTIIVDYSLDDGETWINAGSTIDSTFTISNVIVGKSYMLRVRVQNSAQRLSSGTITSNILITGKDSAPSDLTDFVVCQYGDYIVVSGDNPSDADFNSIEIRYGGTSWDTAKFVKSITSFPSTFSNSGLDNGTIVFRAKAIDNGGNYSVNDIKYIMEVSGVNDYKNVILTRNDISETQTGTLTNLTKTSSNILVSNSSLEYDDFPEMTYDNAPFTEYSNVVKSVSYLSAVIDTGKTGKTGINYIFEYNFYDTTPLYDSFPDRTYDEYPLDTYDHVTVKNTITTKVRFSNDNIQWTSWQTYLAGQYNFRYIQYSLSAEYESLTARAEITKLLQYYDVPDVTFSKTFTIPITGLDVVFADNNADFYLAPTDITPTVINGLGNVYVDITAITATGLHIDCYDRTGAKCAGTVILVCKGY